MEGFGLVMIIVMALAITGFLVYWYLNNKDSDELVANKTQGNRGIKGVEERFWKAIDIAHIDKVIDPKGNGKREGAIDYPSDNETGGKLSPTEDLIVTTVQEHYRSEMKRINQFRVLGSKTTLEEQFRYDKRNMQSNGYRETFQNMKASWASDKDTFITRVKEAIKNRKDAQKKLRSFKLDNRIAVGREPIVSSGWTTFLKLLIPVFLFALEVQLNFNALISSQFILEDQAVYISFIVGSINVVLSFLVGYLVLTHILNPVDATKKPRLLHYGPILGVYLFALVYVNSMMGVYRAAMSQIGNFDGDKYDYFVEWSTNALTPFAHFDALNFDGGLLLFLGAFFAVVTLIDAYFFKDPIPGYSKVGKALIKAEKKVEDLKNTDRARFTSMQNIHLTNLKTKNQAREDSVDSWEHYADELQRIKDLHKKFNDDMTEVLNTSIENYRTKNRQFRHTPAPEYFENPVDSSFIKDFGYTYDHLVDELVDDPEIRRIGGEARKLIGSEYANMSVEYQDFFQHEREELKKIVAELDDSDD